MAQDLQHVLGQFAAKCEAAGKKVACSLRDGGELLPHVEEFKYLWVLFTSEGRMERIIDRWIGAAATVMLSLYWSVTVTKGRNEFPLHGGRTHWSDYVTWLPWEHKL